LRGQCWDSSISQTLAERTNFPFHSCRVNIKTDQTREPIA
jgi:hypothetical protein